MPVTTLFFWLVHIKHESILETIEVFYVMSNAYSVWVRSSIENIINEKSYEPAGTIRDLCSVVMSNFSNCIRSGLVHCVLRTFQTLLVPINHEIHSRSYDFLYTIRTCATTLIKRHHKAIAHACISNVLWRHYKGRSKKDFSHSHYVRRKGINLPSPVCWRIRYTTKI